MSLAPSANIELGLGTSKFTKGTQDAKRGFQEIGASGKQSMTQLKGSIDTTNQSLDKTGTSVDKASRSFSSLAGTAAKMGGIFVGLAANITGVIFAYNDLADVQIKVKSAALNVSKAQEQVNKLQQEGKTNTLDYQQAVEKLSIAQDKQADVLEDADKQQVQFMTNMATMAVTTIPSVISSLVSLKAAHLVGAGAAGVGAGAQLGFTASLSASTAAIWASFVAMLHHPFFAPAAAAAAGVAVGLIATNTWGLRDAILGANIAVKESNKAVDAGSKSFSAYGETVETATGKVTQFGEGLNALSSSFDILSFSLKGVGKPAVNVFQEWTDAIAKAKDQAKELNKEVDNLKKNDNFDTLLTQFKESQGLEVARRLIEKGIELYNNGDLKGAVEVEKALQRIGRNTPSISGTLRSIADQMRQNSGGFQTISNIGGGVGNLFGSDLSASEFTGRQSQNLGLLGMLNLAGLRSMTVSNYTRQTTGFSTAGYVSARLSGGPNSMRSVSRGGNRASGKSAKHGNSGQAKKNKMNKAISGVVGDNDLKELERLTGIRLREPSKMVSGRGWSKFNQGFKEDLQRLKEKLAEANSRISLSKELADFSGDTEILDLLMMPDLLKKTSTELKSILASQQQEAKDYSAKFGLPQSEILTLFKTASGFDTILDMDRFRNREIGAATAT